MSTRIKIILIATIFNVIFELAFRGQILLAQKSLIVGLFLLYFSYFSILEDLIRKYRLTNVQLLLATFAFGLLPDTFMTGLAFTPPLILGVNFSILIAISVVWWGFTQGLLTFYLATRLVKRNWDEPTMSSRGIKLAVGYLIAAHLLIFLSSKTLIKGPAIGYIVILMLFMLIYLYLKKKLQIPQQASYQSQRSGWMDILALGSVIVFLYAGLVAGRASRFDVKANSVISAPSVEISTKWTQFTFFGILLYYIVKRKPITI